MESECKEEKNDKCSFRFQYNINKEKLYGCVLPIVGCVNYQLFAVHAYLPNVLSRTLPVKHYLISNCLLYNSHIGIGLYLYTRRHMKTIPSFYRVLYSVYGSMIFNFGSILLWALTERILPHSKFVRTTVAFTAALGLLITGREYLQFVDSLV